jgi:hypothetical protein
VANAGLVADFWRRYGPTTPSGFSSVTDAAAFQLGLWEIISDGGARDLKSGSFRVGGSASPAVALAESWLNGTGAPAPGAGGSVALHVMQHPTLQDQVIWGPLPPPSVSVKVTPTTGVTEDGPNTLTYEFTASPAPTADITVNYRIGGSATAGSDFTTVLPPGATTGTITIRAGSTSPVTLRIVPTADTEIERDETVVITLQNGTGYAPGTSVATGTILNDDLPGTVTGRGWFDVNDDGSYSASESPLSGIVVNLFDSLGSPALDASLRPVAPTTIDAGATYRFPNLRPGSYTVSFTDTVGYLGPGTAGAVYAGIATVQLAQAAIVDLLFSQIVIPEEPPAPPAPPTADTLTWDDFQPADQRRDAKQELDAETSYGRFLAEQQVLTRTLKVVPQGGLVQATARATLVGKPNAGVTFDSTKSWVLTTLPDDESKAALLEHERLHLRIGEYIATKVAMNFPADMTGNGVATAADKAEAMKAARKNASEDLQTKRLAFVKTVWQPIDENVQEGRYDKETDHGSKPDEQANWARAWQAFVDDELQKQGWKVQ